MLLRILDEEMDVLDDEAVDMTETLLEDGGAVEAVVDDGIGGGGGGGGPTLADLAPSVFPLRLMIVLCFSSATGFVSSFVGGSDFFLCGPGEDSLGGSVGGGSGV